MLIQLFLTTYILTTNFTPFLIEGDSMTPTIKNRQLILLKQHTPTTTYNRNQIIIFEHNLHDNDPEPYYYIKRIIGLPEETVKINSLGIFIKPKSATEFFKLDEPYLTKSTTTFYGLEKTYKIPPNQYFVLGDNRNQSQDSRSFTTPYISETKIHGSLIYPPTN